MNNFPRYESYKDSGVDWLGEIPVHWETRRLKYIFKITKRIAGQLGYEVLSITQKGIKIKDIESGEGQLSMDYSKYQLVYKGDFAMNHMDLLTGYVDISKYDGVISPDYRVFTLTDTNNNKEYLLYLLQLGYLNKIFYSYGQGVSLLGRWRFPAENFNDFLFPLPPIEEQSAITEFLDRKTAQIEQAIAQKERLIELLKERRQILINKAVTRGLNPNVKFKHSGVDRIGEIPEHWKILYNRRLFREKSRKITNPNELPLSLSQVDGVIPSQDMKERSLSPAHRDNFKLCLQGDLIVNRFKGHLGVFFESKYRGIVTFHYGIFEPEKDVNTKYFELLYHTEIYKTIYAGASNGMTVGLQNLSNQNFYDVRSIVPPIDEQNRIVAHCERMWGKVETAISCKQKEIEKLKEYKAVSINSAVTGKIKVCGNSQNAEVKSNYAKSNE